MLVDRIWPCGGSVWAEEDVFAGMRVDGCIHACEWVCEKWVIVLWHWALAQQNPSADQLEFVASLALDILRGMQGVGAAATIPASVSVFPPTQAQKIEAFVHSYLVGYSGTRIPAFTSSFPRFCYIRCWGACGRGAGHGRWGRVDSIDRVRFLFIFPSFLPLPVSEV